MDAIVSEALRYLGAGDKAPEELRIELGRIAGELAALLPPRHVCRLFPLERTGTGYALPGSGVTLAGESAGKMLEGCHSAALLCCTLGLRFDSLLRERQARDMAEAVMLDACGSALVEQGCDGAEAEIKSLAPGMCLTDRFSPGYGDLPLSLQGPLCAALDAERRLGVYVTESLLLSPAKTVTAVVGIADTPRRARIRGCGCCAMRRDCELRKGGKSCAL